MLAKGTRASGETQTQQSECVNSGDCLLAKSWGLAAGADSLTLEQYSLAKYLQSLTQVVPSQCS